MSTTWKAFQPVALLAALLAALLLVLGLLVSQGITEIITPPPERVAETMVSAIAAHREEGAWNQLSQNARQQVTRADLDALANAIQQSSRQGIEDAHGEQAETQGDTGTARVRVQLGDQSETTLDFLMVQEDGLWRVDSIEPLQALAR